MYAGLGVLTVATMVWRMVRAGERLDRLRAGFDAEVAVGQELDQLMRQGAFVFHDFPCERFNIDRFSYPVEAIFNLLARLDYSRCLIVTDTPRHEAVEQFVREHRGFIAARDRAHDYRTLFHARRLIMSPSTFSWWAAWSGS